MEDAFYYCDFAINGGSGFINRKYRNPKRKARFRHHRFVHWVNYTRVTRLSQVGFCEKVEKRGLFGGK